MMAATHNLAAWPDPVINDVVMQEYLNATASFAERFERVGIELGYFDQDYFVRDDGIEDSPVLNIPTVPFGLNNSNQATAQQEVIEQGAAANLPPELLNALQSNGQNGSVATPGPSGSPEMPVASAPVVTIHG